MMMMNIFLPETPLNGKNNDNMKEFCIYGPINK